MSGETILISHPRGLFLLMSSPQSINLWKMNRPQRGSGVLKKSSAAKVVQNDGRLSSLAAAGITVGESHFLKTA
ncbi:hypothetical protein ABFP30_000822 [Enterobacter bugandensis]